ncbi:MAG: hybrid sensor histidine kinase/response regulator [Polyangiaceae bacterium]|nr:hybrid sensor histidine kinase/response regulator [Polyangiaceae bacterium]
MDPNDPLAEAFEHAPTLQALLDENGVVARVSRRFAGVFGEDAVGRRADELMEGVSTGLASFVRRLLSRQAEFRVDDLLVRTRAEGELRVEAHGAFIAGGHGYLLALVDQTERVTTSTARAQRERSETIARFSGGLSHDVNNMLSTIVSTAQAGLQDALEGEGDPARDFRAIIDFAERGAALARSLRSIAFEETGSWRPVDLAEEIRAIAAVLGRGSAGVPIVLDLEPRVAEVVGDRARLHQLILNLMVNARDATRSRGGGIEVELKRRPSGGVRFSVADSGPGIPNELRARIFEPYFTTKGGDAEQGGECYGTGLGLAIVDAVARTTGATVTVDASRAGGALFIVDWPITSVVQVDPVVVTVKEAVGSAVTLLLADDEAALVGAVARQLRRAGHTVFAALSAAESRDLFRTYAAEIEVAVIDVRLRDGDGRQLAEELRAARPGLGIVLISASGSRAAPSLGPQVRLLEKPFDFKELTAAIALAQNRPRT